MSEDVRADGGDGAGHVRDPRGAGAGGFGPPAPLAAGPRPFTLDQDAEFRAFADRCVFVDLETLPDGSIRAAGAVHGDRTLRLPGSGESIRDLATALKELERFADGADFVAGHNLIAHDVPTLARAATGMRLPHLPAVDTLVLSPLAFPRRPYHQLVKDYKLVRDEKADPVADARLARRLLSDEWHVFRDLRHRDPELLDLFTTLLHGWVDGGDSRAGLGAGTAALLRAAGGRIVPDPMLCAVLAHRFPGRLCTTALPAMVAATLASAAMRPALAYAVAWIDVADTRSVLPRWVHREFPYSSRIIEALREAPCHDDACAWCRSTHDPRGELRRLFGFDAFRGGDPQDDRPPLQERIVVAGMAGRSLLAVLPTSFGKSLCFQLPAIVRFTRRNLLTIVISPLQALMKDQVDVLESRASGRYAAALMGMLTPPERADVLDRVRDGDVALLYVSPEQLRNRSFVRAVRGREIACWVFDEAHCLSKWGHDFRPDYHYAGRFIREFTSREGLPPPVIACFTATAKGDVKQEIVGYFRQELGVELDTFEAGVERENLTFSVREVVESDKRLLLREEIDERLGDRPGSAIVYVSRRKRAEEFAEYLVGHGFSAAAFHAGIEAPLKRTIQERFKSGGLRVICATNAFGMGIDKPDVRLVVHLDVPGSLENYIQEAGRAGRDGLPSHCVLFFAPADLEWQFQLSADSRVTRRDISQLLQAVRRARRPDGRQDVVVTPGELLQDDRTDVSFDLRERSAKTKVHTAVSWLERAEFLERNENHTRVFQGRPQVRDMDEARERIEKLSLSDRQRSRWLAILHALMNADERSGLDMDELAEATGFGRWEENAESPQDSAPTRRRPAGLQLLRTLRDMTREGLLDEGLVMSAFVRRKMEDDSLERLRRVADLERAFLEVLEESTPDTDPADGEWLRLDLRQVNQVLVERGHDAGTEALRRLLHSLAQDGRGLEGGEGSVALKHVGGDAYRVRLQRNWSALTETADLRRGVAERALEAILLGADRKDLPRGQVLVTFGMSELLDHVERFPAIRSRLKDPVAALERALLFLHEQEVVTLQQGLALFRQAMEIHVRRSAHGRQYTAEDYTDLEHHYAERVFQVHAMGEYARLGIEEPRRAARFVLEYFERDKDAFVAEWFTDREDVLARCTSQESYRRVVDELGNRSQESCVKAPPSRNLLVLAGPGSGKTRVVVHRCAYLLLVERVPAEAILVLCFNRAAMHELRTRLRDLAGPAANGVNVHTYHGLALRLTGRSVHTRLRERPSDQPPFDFSEILEDALRLLRGETTPAGFEPDALRDRLLSGYQHVLVDEYQDIDARQYELIGLIADRSDAGEERPRATLFAVGDDDQNVYSWRGADVEFLRRFHKDYRAEVRHLLENYRSTAHVVAAANHLIEHAPVRMKEDRRLRIDSGRKATPRGGDLQIDRISRGRVQVLRVHDRGAQVSAAFDEIERIRGLLPTSGYGDFAILARTRRELEPFRAWCAWRNLPHRVVVGAEGLPGLHAVRELAAFLAHVESLGDAEVSHDDLARGLPSPAGARNPWAALARRALDEWTQETGATPQPASAFAEHVHEFLVDHRRGHVVGEGIFLGTVHGAKGLEFPHVVLADGGWDPGTRHDGNGPGNHASTLDEERRVYFVGMTRARQSLTLLCRADCRNPFVDEVEDGSGKFLSRREVPGARIPESAPPDLLRQTRVVLSLSAVDIGYAGRFGPSATVHEAVAALATGDPVELVPLPGGQAVLLQDKLSRAVGRLSIAARDAWLPRLAAVSDARVFAIVRRTTDLTPPEYRDDLRCGAWEVPLVEVTCR